MRWMVLAALLAGCDAEGSGLINREVEATPPPPVPLADGTPVVQSWQFRGECQQPRTMFLWRQDVDVILGHVLVDPNDVIGAPIRCPIGSVVCTGPSSDRRGEYDAGNVCRPCSAGYLPALPVGCQ